METLGYYNGETSEIEDIRIPMNDRASWFGDGIYDAALAVDHRIVFLEEHIERFFRSASLLGMVPPLDREALRRLLEELVLKVESGCQFVYWQLTRGTGPRAHVFPETKPNLWVFLRPSSPPDCSRKMKLITVPDTRFFHCNIKTLNLIPNVLASQKAKEAGADEAVFYRTPETAGAAAFPPGSLTRVTECSHSNVSIISNGVFWTAPLDNFILPGIARSHLIKQCRTLDIPVREEAFGLEELFSAGEVIVSSSGAFCMEVSHIDGKSVGGKDRATAARLRKAVLGEVETYLTDRNEPPRSKQHLAQRGTPTEPRSGEGSPLDVDQERFAFLSFAVKDTSPTGYNSTLLYSGAKIISSNCQPTGLIQFRAAL